ncbi:hypothetical protein [uncultured Thiodictyon sp.]|uniref:hypothetical protein n=1 Tax=uncultured Thiodictyon sp. TaxID=1846217 RepID=UPI0025CD337D|nr:hypothetical protein [uncultured Thiodictyon sp.]
MDEEVTCLLVAAYIYQFHPELYRRWEACPDLYQFILDWVRGGQTDLGFLSTLTLPLLISTDESTPTPSYSSRSAFPDPTESNVFWIQPLILRLGNSATPAAGSWPKSCHVFEQREAYAIQAASAAGRPLLVRGQPGVGKKPVGARSGRRLRAPVRLSGGPCP